MLTINKFVPVFPLFLGETFIAKIMGNEVAVDITLVYRDSLIKND